MTTVNEFMGSIYKWMAAGVAVSALFAWLTMYTELSVVLYNKPIFYGVIAAQLVLLFGIQFLINKLPYKVSFLLFFVYAALTGISISGLLAHFVFGGQALVPLVIFGVAVTMFIALATLGYNTKYDMTGWKTFLFAGMWGVFIASIVNIFLGSSLLDIIVSAVALLVFAGLTVFDAQFYKNLYPQLQTEEDKAKYSTLGALHMYINLLMMFQTLLNLTSYFGGND